MSVMIPKSELTAHFTRRFKDVVMTKKQLSLFQEQLEKLTALRKFAIYYLEHTYGVRHLKRDFPSTQVEKAALASVIARRWFANVNGFQYTDDHKKLRWDKRVIQLHSLSVQRNLVELITNFDLYRRELISSILHGSLISRKRYLYNQKGHNRRHQKAICANSLSYKKIVRTVMFPTSGNMKKLAFIVSNHFVKLPGYGLLYVKENLSSMKKHKVVQLTLVKQSNGRIDLHVACTRTVNRQRHNLNPRGLDWNLYNNVPYTDNFGKPYQLYKAILTQANTIDDDINLQRSLISYLQKHGGLNTNRYQNALHQLNKLTQKRSNIIDNEYISLANRIVKQSGYIAVESLDFNQMVAERAKKNQKSANHRFKFIKPSTLFNFLVQAAYRQGSTVVTIDCYKTSQMIFGTDYHCEKHSTSDRHWYSDYVHREIFRDENAAKNILYWSIHPEKHIKIFERKMENRRLAQQHKKLKPVIKPSYVRQFC